MSVEISFGTLLSSSTTSASASVSTSILTPYCASIPVLLKSNSKLSPSTQYSIVSNLYVPISATDSYEI